ncbi:MAG TPA: septum formation initiator family protein [Candidatus Binataceae bacterium]|nr:septum formation initiator family protein [Candidatus Binataceae bacterium]
MTRLSFLIRREWLSLILGSVLVALAANALAGRSGPRDLIALRQHRAELEAQRAQLIADNAALRTSLQKLRSDNRYIEGVIRRELGYARPGEIVYKFTGPADNSPR